MFISYSLMQRKYIKVFGGHLQSRLTAFLEKMCICFK